METQTMATAAQTEVTETTFRTPRGVAATMAWRPGTNDWNTLNACMTEDEYGLRDFTGSGFAIDIGGYLGGVAIGLALDNPELRVLVVEPVPDNARLIRRNIDLNGLADRVTLLQGAAGDGSEVDVWHGYRGNPTAEHHRFVGNSSLAYDHGGELQHETETYQSWTLAELIREFREGPFRYDLEGVAIVKIDCEGGEWSILADPAANARCGYIVGEAHSTRGHKGSDIVDLLSDTHIVTLQGDPEATCEFRAVAR